MDNNLSESVDEIIMDNHLYDSIDQIIKRLDQNEQSKFDRLMEQVNTIQSILQTQDHKQCLVDKKLEVVTNLDTLLDKKLEVVTNLDTLLDKKLEVVTNLDTLLDKKLSTMAHLETVLDKKLQDVTKLDSLLDKKFLIITDSDNMLNKKLSDIIIADNLLDKKLSDITSVDSLFDKKISDLTKLFWQENTNTLQELKNTQNEILGHLHGMQSPVDVAVSQDSAHTNVQAVSTEQHLYECSVDKTKEEFEKLDQKTRTMLHDDPKDQTRIQGKINTVHIEKKDSEEAGRVLAESGSISDLVRCHTKTELDNLDSQINQRLDAIEASFRENLQLINKEVNKNTAQNKWIVNVLKEKGIIPQEKNCESMIVEKFQLSLEDRQNVMTDELTSLSLEQDSLKTKIEQCAESVKNYIYTSKMEIFAVIEKEAQIVRDRIEGPLTCHGEYVFDFYVDNFKMLVRSQKDIHSPPWHINEMRSCMMGMIWFPATGEMEVCFVFARHPREIGLQPSPAIKLKVKSTIRDIHKKVLPNVDVGEKVWTVKEKNISCNFDWGCKLGILSCDDLLHKGYGDKEGYRFGAMMVRFNVTVCHT